MTEDTSGSLPSHGDSEHWKDRHRRTVYRDEPESQEAWPRPRPGVQEGCLEEVTLQRNQAGETGVNQAGRWGKHAGSSDHTGRTPRSGVGPSGERTGELRAGPVSKGLGKQA